MILFSGCINGPLLLLVSVSFLNQYLPSVIANFSRSSSTLLFSFVFRLYPQCYLKFYATLPKPVSISQPKILTCLLKPAFPFPWLFYFPTYFLTLFHPLLGTSRQLKANDVSQASSLSKGIPDFSHLSVQHMCPESPVCNSTPCGSKDRPEVRQPRLFLTSKIPALRNGQALCEIDRMDFQSGRSLRVFP